MTYSCVRQTMLQLFLDLHTFIDDIQVSYLRYSYKNVALENLVIDAKKVLYEQCDIMSLQYVPKLC